MTDLLGGLIISNKSLLRKSNIVINNLKTIDITYGEGFVLRGVNFAINNFLVISIIFFIIHTDKK